MFSSAKKSEGLDQPLLASNDDADDAGTRPPVAVATHVGVVGYATRPGYNKVLPTEDDEDEEQARAEAAARANLVAMRRQQEHAQNFEREMLTEEQRIIKEAREKKAREKEDERLARELQAQFENEAQGAVNVSQPPPPVTTMLVTVPQGVRGGQPLAVEMPGRGTVQILIPQGLKPGDTFQFKVANSELRQSQPSEVRVRVPAGARPGSTFPVQLPSNKIVMVGVPPGVRPGDELRVPFDINSGVLPAPMPVSSRATSSVPTSAPPAAVVASGARPARGPAPDEEQEALAIMESIMEVKETAEERAEREAFLAALPEDVRREVLAQETAQKKHLSTFAKAPAGPSLTAEQLALLETLPVELRAEVERDMHEANAAAAAAAPKQQTQSRPAPPVAPPVPSPPVGDLLDTASLYPTAAPVDDTANLFSNLSVRGVGSATKDAKSKSQQI